jgi:transcription elongation GreA/GreB family factor
MWSRTGECILSVAFRRESDEEHKEPRFEIPLPPGPNLVTERGLAQIQTRVRELEEQVASENDQGARECALRDLRYWKTRRATAELVPRASADEVTIGTRVRIHLNGEERTISVVGHDEADPAEGIVSYSAPLAQALLGAGVGDQLSFAGKEGAITILQIEPIV